MALAPPPDPVIPTQPDAGVNLRNIAAWWRAERDRLLPAYLRRTYPAFLHRRLDRGRLNMREVDAGSPDGRRAWLGLFLLAMTQRIGLGGGHGQQHREFLNLCDERGWLDVFANPRATPDAWVGVIDGFLDGRLGHVEYLHWLQHLFVGARIVSRWLDDYVEVLRQLRDRLTPFGLLQALQPGADPELSGSGIYAPPLDGVLGLGASFLLRELTRGGYYPAPAAVAPHCYTPVGSVRRLMRGLGCQGLANREGRWERSRTIHDFLSEHIDDPTFGGDYDIPLRVVSRDADLRARFHVDPLSAALEADEEFDA